MKLIVGLGNPGKKYEKTRHNVGFVMIDKLQDNYIEQGIDFTEFKLDKDHNAEISEGRIGSEKVLLVKPQTFMNNSGQPTQSLASFYKVDPGKDFVVIYDDIDIKLGEIKTTGTSAGGHNGMKDIIEKLGTDNINRIRIGILGKSKDKISDTANYVLKKFGLTERGKISKVTNEVIATIDNFLK